MICKNCQKEIDSDSKLCEFCGAKVKNTFKESVGIPVTKEMDKGLDSLKSKPWYRFLKVLYIIGFCILILAVLIEVPFVEKHFIDRDIIINCENYTAQDRSFIFPIINIANAGYISARMKALEIKTNEEMRELCYGKRYYLNIDFHFDRFFMLVATLLFTVVIFELLRQLGYYIFLGKTYPNRLTTKLIHFWKS
jgi:hypothetical protein